MFALRHPVELVSKELNHLAAILHVYAGGLNFIEILPSLKTEAVEDRDVTLDQIQGS